MEEGISRRRFIHLGTALGVGAAGASVLAACRGGESGSDTTNRQKDISNPGVGASTLNRMEAGIHAYHTENTMADLKALSTSTLEDGTVRYVLGYHAPRDGGGGLFQYVASSSDTDDGGLTIAPTSGGGRWERIFDRSHLSALWFGAKADGTTNDSPTVSAMIVAAEADKIRKMLFPWGASGIYLLSGSIVNGRTLASGLEFVGVGQTGPQGTDPPTGVQLKYTGSTVCFSVKPPNGTGEIGNWYFKDLKCYSTHATGTFFEFGDMSQQMTDGSDSQEYQTKVVFENVTGWGPIGSNTRSNTTVTADFIRANGVFELQTDDSCYVRSWRRGLWLKDCDNARIRGRFVGNVRDVMLDRGRGTFGNDAVIDAQAMLSNINDGSESSCHIWNEYFNTTVHHANFEDFTRAVIYHDGQGLVVYNPNINIAWEAGPHPAPNNVVLHQGPNGQEWTIISPESLTDLGHCVNIFDAPAGGYNQRPPNQISKVKVFWPTGRLEDTLFAPHPRLEVISLRNPAPAALRVGGVTATGEHIGRRLVSALNIETAYEAGGLPFISDIVADTDAFGGWAVQLVGNSDNPPAFLVPLWVGTDVRNGHTVTLKVRYRVPTPTAGGFRHVMQANGVTLETAAIPPSTRYATHTITHMVNGRSVGDVLTFGVYNPSDQTAHVSSLLVEVS